MLILLVSVRQANIPSRARAHTPTTQPGALAAQDPAEPTWLGAAPTAEVSTGVHSAENQFFLKYLF